MKAHELKTLLANLLSEAEAVRGIAVAAEKSRQSLGGHSRYAVRFHEAVVSLTASEKKIRPHLDGLSLAPEQVAEFDTNLEKIKNATTKKAERTAAVRALRLVCETEIVHKAEAMTASPIPSTETVLPLALVKGTRNYLEKIVNQVNGCFEHCWYDACCIMIRKLAEILIIEVYEHKGLSAEIKDGKGQFFMLSGLIDHIEKKTEWNLHRDTLTCLDKMKEAGNHSAHVRRYVANINDVQKVLSTIRLAVEELLHLANLKK